MATIPNPAQITSVIDHSLQSGRIEDLLKLQEWIPKITSILDLDLLIDQIVNHVSCAFGCVEANLYLHDEERGELELACVCGCTLHDKGDRLRVGIDGMVGRVASTGKLHYAPDVRLDPYYLACEESTLSEVAIPLIVDGKVVGVFSASHSEVDAFPPQQLQLLHALCEHIAIALQNCKRFRAEQEQRQRMTRESEEARIIQQALLPKASPFVPGFAISGLSVPAGDIGGDWYDFIPFNDGCWGLVLADVSGKGTAAALLMSATRAMLRSLADTCSSPAETLAKLNQLMVEDFPTGRFVTLIYAILDPTNRTLKFASAGHLPPLLVEGDHARFLPTEAGTPLGLAVSSFSESEIELPPGSRLVLYSDGITEASAFDEEEYGSERLREHVLNPLASSESILTDVRHYVNGAGLQDDATVIFVKA